MIQTEVTLAGVGQEVRACLIRYDGGVFVFDQDNMTDDEGVNVTEYCG